MNQEKLFEMFAPTEVVSQRELSPRHTKRQIALFYKGSGTEETRRQGELVFLDQKRGIITVKTHDKDSDYKTFRLDRIGRGGFIAIY